MQFPRFIKYENLIQVANQFLARHHPEMTVPVPIEEIAEFSLNIQIIPTNGLHHRFSVDACVSRDLTEIRVDRQVFDYGGTRLKFSIAHEIAHMLLNHYDLLDKVSTPQEWIAAIQDMPRDVHDRLEYQANCIAAGILVPRHELSDRFVAIKTSITSENVSPLEVQDAVEKIMANEYKVSPLTMHVRLQHERLLKYPWDD